jgi:hypothetical protein
MLWPERERRGGRRRRRQPGSESIRPQRPVDHAAAARTYGDRVALVADARALATACRSRFCLRSAPVAERRPALIHDGGSGHTHRATVGVGPPALSSCTVKSTNAIQL